MKIILGGAIGSAIAALVMFLIAPVETAKFALVTLVVSIATIAAVSEIQRWRFRKLLREMEKGNCNE